MTKKTKKDSKPQDKKTLLELVAESEVRSPIIMMELHHAGLLEQYQYEKEMYGLEELEPSLTQKEFDKIIGA
jgi:hypothetical protein